PGLRLGPARRHRRLALRPSYGGYTRPQPHPGQGRCALRDNETTDIPSADVVRVLLVDDHDLFRRGLRSLLEEHGVDIVGEAASGTEALAISRETAPDVIVMDLNMPGMTGVEATRQIATEAPRTRVLVLTISDE